MSDVYVYIYDISRGVARSMSQPLLGRQIDGVWHTGIVAYGVEWYFGSGGISSCPPCGTILGQPDQKQLQGRTHVSYDDFYSHINNLSRTTFKGSDYHLLNHNCNNFSDHISEFLTGRKIPSHITGLPREVLSTPFGQLLMPMLEQMSVNPGANHPVDFDRPTGPSTAQPSAPSSSSSSSPPSSASASTRGKHVNISARMIEAATAELVGAIPDDDQKAQLEEIKEYCLLPTSTTSDWSLGRPHLHLLARFTSSSSTSSSSSSSSACDLLAAMMNREELVAMTTRDPKRTLQTLTASCDSRHDSLRVLANLTRHSAQRRWFLDAKEPLVKEATTTTAFGVLTRLMEQMMERRFDDQHSHHFACLFYNACLGLRDSSKTAAAAAAAAAAAGSDGDFVSSAALEMTTPLLEFFVKLQSESVETSMTPCVETLLEAMDVLVGINEDARELSKCYGIQTDKIQIWSPNSKHLATRIFG